jgi:predicted dehydrogenase
MLDTAVVGLGWWGTQVAKTLVDSDKINIVAGVDPAAATRDAWAETYDLPVIADFDAALADDRIDAVILTTPHSLHEDQVLAAAAAGKQIFCEKPMTLTAASARRMIEACAAKDIIMGLGHERRHEHAMEEIKRMVDEGEFGTVLHVEAHYSHDKFATLAADNWRGNVKDAPAAGWTGMGIHQTDMFISLIGPIVEVHTYSAKRVLDLPSGDVVSVQFKFADGTTGHVGVVSATPFYGRFAIYGQDAWVEARETSHPVDPDVTQFYCTRKGKDRQTMAIYDPVDTVKMNFEAWADAAMGRSQYRFTDIERMANVAVLEALVRSAETGQPEAVEQS